MLRLEMTKQGLERFICAALYLRDQRQFDTDSTHSASTDIHYAIRLFPYSSLKGLPNTIIYSLT